MSRPKVVVHRLTGVMRFLLYFLYDAFIKDFSRYLLLVALLLLIGGILSGAFTAAYGGPQLFWSEHFGTQLLAGIGIGLLLAKIFFVGFLLNTKCERRWLDAFRKNELGNPSDPFVEAIIYLLGSAFVVALLAIVVLMIRYAFPDSMDGPFSSYRPSQFVALPLGAIAAYSAILIGVLWPLAIWSSCCPTTKNKFDVLPLFFPGLGKDKKGRLHAVAAVSMLVLLIFYVGGPHWFSGFMTPVTALCTLLGLFVGAVGVFAFRIRNGSLLIGITLVACWIGGRSVYKVRLPVFSAAHLYDNNLVDITEPCRPSTKPAGLIHVEQTPWQPGRRAPLAIVCASGGGIRAMVWTGAILSAIEEHVEGFPYHIKLVTGASGGMVGATYYVQTVQPPGVATPETVFHHPVTSSKLVDQLGLDDLSAVVTAGVYRDVPSTFFFNAGVGGPDRGQALEDAWAANLGSDFARSTLGSIADGEREGWRPSLVFSPMMVEDGRRLLISNLNLDFMTFSHGPLLGDVGPDVARRRIRNRNDATTNGTYSRSAIELSQFFPQVWSTFPLTTAARLSASFPYFSPAAELPCTPRRRVVDAGYYDNYGLSVAIAWLDQLVSTHEGRDWLCRNVSGIVVIQIRDGVNQLSGEKIPTGNGPSGLARGLEWLSTPPAGLLAARDAVTLFRNDAQLQRLSERYHDFQSLLRPAGKQGEPVDPLYFTTVVFENPGNESLSWHLSTSEAADLADAARGHLNLESLAKWWSAHSK